MSWVASVTALMLSIMAECSGGDEVSQLRLSFACGNYDRMAALRTGDVTAEGIELNYIAIDSPREIFDRMGSRQEFDVAEFSSSEFISTLACGDCPLLALPVFPSRVYRHSHIYINRRSGISDIHIRRDQGYAEVCVHFDPAKGSHDEVVALVRASGLEVAKRYKMKSWFVRVSKITLPRDDRIRELVEPPPDPPPLDCPVRPLAISSAFA